MSRLQELDVQILAQAIERLVARSARKVTRFAIARELGSLHSGDKIDQQVARAGVRHPQLFAFCDVQNLHLIPREGALHPLLEEIAAHIRERKNEIAA